MADEIPPSQLAGKHEVVSEPPKAAGRSGSPLSRLSRRVGRWSLFAGLALLALGIVLLAISVVIPSIVLEVESIVSFVAGLVVLFKNPRAQVQTRVLDALLLSTSETIVELASLREYGSGFTYVPSDGRLAEVCLFRTSDVAGSPSPEKGRGDLPLSKTLRAFTPPGRALASLYERQAGNSSLAEGEGAFSQLESVLVDDFGLADSVEVKVEANKCQVSLLHPAVAVSCTEDQERTMTGGRIGCPISSFFAILVAFAYRRPVELERCTYDESDDKWYISLSLEPEERRMGV